MTPLTGQELHNLAMNIVGEALQKELQWEFLLVNSELKRGCTIIDGIGWYSKSSQKIVIVIARRTEATSIFRLVRTIDPAAFVTKTNVMGVYGNGFDKLK